MQAGKVLTHRQLLRQVWGEGYEGEIHLLRVNMSNLRHKLGRRQPAGPHPHRARSWLSPPRDGG